MSSMKFTPGYFEALLTSPGVESVVMESTNRIAAIARSTAPVDTGDYKRGIKATKKRQKRVVGLVQATDPKSMGVEAATGNLARAVRGGRR